jgi:hypothetical protein
MKHEKILKVPIHNCRFAAGHGKYGLIVPFDGTNDRVSVFNFLPWRAEFV